ncbi:hypothetical protein A1O3_05988 [Capronia epimyces CBS 606.96]|uniref:Nitroreductase domain-containing protein n=1 Tax=Capronia epimyces CBS 606.96 TaxID=1182542 RepID=W9XYH1_9EURO|nr:uncharacterized protein A1O3_05988 [Capronia epimyces CBS 606.96]EXJ85313.1 hypothetical protein A1O3_05988 [Capronia epimyces CBS 606.96]
MSTLQTFQASMLQRRTVYNLQGNSPISNAEIQDIIRHALLHVPSSFNSQSTRIVLLVGHEHAALWDIVKDVLSGIVPGQAFATTEKKLESFQRAYGTILFFEDQSTIRDYQNRFPLYADRFPVWASESSGMHQYAIWTALACQDLGANLQHYNPLIDDLVTARWNLPQDWKLAAQMVIGTPTRPPGVKTFQPLEERFRTYGEIL